MKHYAADLKLIVSPERKDNMHCLDQFALFYDTYIEQSTFENIELYLRNLAKKFYEQGYVDGQSKLDI